MENFTYDGEYCDSIEDLIFKLVVDEEEIYELPDDFEIKCYETKAEKIVGIDEYWILERIDEDRLPEDDWVSDKILKILKENINFDKINEAMPELWYETGKSFIITKQDLIDYIK